MKKIFTYIKLQFKLQFKKDNNVDIKGKLAVWILGLATCFVVLFLAKYLFDILCNQFLSSVSCSQLAVVVFSVLELVLFFVGMSLEIKYLLRPKDSNISARFPMSSFSLFVARLLIVFIWLVVISFATVFALMMLFGISANVLSFSYIIKLVFVCLVSPVLPFALSCLIAAPTMHLLKIFENKNILKLVLFFVVLAVGFFAYSRLLNFLAEFYIQQKVDMNTKSTVVYFVNLLGSDWNVFGCFGKILFDIDIFKNIGIFLGATVVLLGLGFAFVFLFYSKLKSGDIDERASIFSKKTKISSEKPFFAIFKKEFKQILRTSTYAYFYLGVAIITPIMVFLTNNMIQKVGKAQIGGDINFAVSLLVVLAFMAMINSFSGTAISREGKQFYITKIVPVDYRKQLLAKGFLNVLISVGALIVSLILLCSMNFVTVGQGFLLFAIAMLMSFGIIFCGFNINVRHPYLKCNSAGEENQTNITTTLFLGFLLTALEGGVSIVLSFFVKSIWIYLSILFVSILFVVANVLVFVFLTNKRYAKIE